MGSKFNNFYEKCEKTIETSNKIESLYEELGNIEFKYGKDSNEYKMLTKIIESTSLTEYNDIKYFLSSPYVDYFEKYISLSGCERLKEKIDKCFNFQKEKKEDDELNNNRLCRNIFNLIQSKSYINVLDIYINREEDAETKKYLIEEKYNVIQRNAFLESWYFNTSNVCMLVESDFLTSLEVGIDEKEYVNLKNNYYANTFSRFLDLICSNKIDPMDEIVYETNLMSVLLCMNNKFTFEKLYELRNDIRLCLIEPETKTFINNIYSNYLKLEKKMKIRYRNEEIV